MSHTGYTNTHVTALPEMWRSAWRDLKITITDEEGNIYESPNYYVKGLGDVGNVESPESTCRYGGQFHEGEN